jgi:hypothetical protein
MPRIAFVMLSQASSEFSSRNASIQRELHGVRQIALSATYKMFHKSRV